MRSYLFCWLFVLWTLIIFTSPSLAQNENHRDSMVTGLNIAQIMAPSETPTVTATASPESTPTAGCDCETGTPTGTPTPVFTPDRGARLEGAAVDRVKRLSAEINQLQQKRSVLTQKIADSKSELKDIETAISSRAGAAQELQGLFQNVQ